MSKRELRARRPRSSGSTARTSPGSAPGGRATSGITPRSRPPTSTSPSSTTGSASSPIAGSKTSASADAGEAGAFVEGGTRVARDGQLPVNTEVGSSPPVGCTVSASCTRRASSFVVREATVRSPEAPKSRRSESAPGNSGTTAMLVTRGTRTTREREHGGRASRTDRTGHRRRQRPRSLVASLLVESGARVIGYDVAPVTADGIEGRRVDIGDPDSIDAAVGRARRTGRRALQHRRAAADEARRSTSCGSTSSVSATSPSRSHRAWNPGARVTSVSSNAGQRMAGSACRARGGAGDRRLRRRPRPWRGWPADAATPTCTRRSWCSSTRCAGRTRCSASTASA